MTSFFYDQTFEQLEAAARRLGPARYRTMQVWQAVYRDLAAAPESITTSLACCERELAARVQLQPLQPRVEAQSTRRARPANTC